jgi:hypothetical protein
LDIKGNEVAPKFRERAPRKCKFSEITGCTGSHPPSGFQVFRDKTPDETSRINENNKLCPFCLLYRAEEFCYLRTYKTKPVCPVPDCKELHIEWLHHVLHGLPCKKDMSTWSINVVQEHEGWRTQEDSWIDMEAAMEEAFFVNQRTGGGQEVGTYIFCIASYTHTWLLGLSSFWSFTVVNMVERPGATWAG